MRKLAPILIAWLSVSACAAHSEPKCAEFPAHSQAKAAPAPAAPAAPVSGRDRLIKSLLDGIVQPTPGQFPTPESVLGYLIETIVSRDISASVAAFPVMEAFERVKLKDRVEYAGHFSPGMFPLDDDPQARLSYVLTGYLASYRAVALHILSDETVLSVPPSGDLSFLQEFDGSRLKAAKVTSMTELPDGRREPNPIERATGVTEKRLFSVKVALDQRTAEVLANVGLVGGDWRVLSVFPGR